MPFESEYLQFFLFLSHCSLGKNSSENILMYNTDSNETVQLHMLLFISVYVFICFKILIIFMKILYAVPY